MADNSNRKSRRDAGAPEAAPEESAEQTAENTDAPQVEETSEREGVPGATTIPPEPTSVEAAIEEAASTDPALRTSLPIGEEQIEGADPGALTPEIPVTGTPTVAPAGAPAGSTWTDQADQQPSTLNEIDGGPTLAYIVEWDRAAVTVRPDALQSRTVGEGDDAVEERYLTVRGPAGEREAILAGQQVVLLAGEVLPPEAAEGEGAKLLTFGAVRAISVPPE